MITTSPVSSNQEMSQVMSTLLLDMFANQLIIGDIHAPLNQISDIYKIVEDNKIIRGWSIFHGFEVPTIIFPPHLKHSWPAIKNMIQILQINEFNLSFPYIVNNKTVEEYPWTIWNGYEPTHLLTDNAMRMVDKELEVMDVSNLPKIRLAQKEDIPLLDKFFEDLKRKGELSGFWDPIQLEMESFVIVEDEGKIIATGGTHFETPFSMQLGNIHVLEEYRRRGIGTAITTAIALGSIKSQRVPTLFVGEDNEGAIKMYENIGFKPYNKLIFYNMKRILN